MADVLFGILRTTVLSLLAISCFGEIASAEVHTGTSGNSRAFADGPGYGYGGALGGVGPCSPVSGATNVANPSFNTPIVPGQQAPGAAPQTVASRPAPTPTPAPKPTSAPEPSSSSASNAKQGQGGGAGPDPAPGKDDGPADDKALADAKKVFDAKCMTCHASNGLDAIASGVARMGDSGNPMPPTGTLTADEKESIEKWINSKKK